MITLRVIVDLQYFTFVHRLIYSIFHIIILSLMMQKEINIADKITKGKTE